MWPARFAGPENAFYFLFLSDSVYNCYIMPISPYIFGVCETDDLSIIHRFLDQEDDTFLLGRGTFLIASLPYFFKKNFKSHSKTKNIYTNVAWMTVKKHNNSLSSRISYVGIC